MTDKITATPTMARCVMCSAEIAQKDWGTHAKIHRAAPLMLEALEAIVEAAEAAARHHREEASGHEFPALESQITRTRAILERITH